MRVLLAAEESAGIQTLRELLRAGHELLAVATCARRSGGATVADAAKALGVPVLPAERVSSPDLADWIRQRAIDLLLNVHSLHLIHADVLRAARIGSFNLHPGPLPAYAGLNAPSWAIYYGETRHAVTLHWMDPAIDAGPVAYESWFELTGDDTGLTVSTKCVRAGIPLVRQLLETAAADPASIPAVPQDLSGRRYFGRRDLPEDGKVRWSQPASRLAAFVRACDYAPFASPWPPPVARLGDHDVGVLRVEHVDRRSTAPPGTVGEVVGGAVEVATGDDWLLVDRIRLNGRSLPAAEVLKPGARLADGA